MEKIKASKVFAIIKKNYKFLCVDTSGDVSISTHLPEPWIDGDDITWLSSDEHDSIFSTPTIDTRAEISKEESLSSLREIDFSEDFTEERLVLIDYIISYLAKELSLRDYNRIKGFFEEMQKPDYVKGFIKYCKLSPSAQPIKKEETKLEKIALSDVLKRNILASERARARTSKYVGFYENGNLFLSDEVPSELEVGKGFKIYEIDHSPANDESQDPKIYSFSGNADELRAYFKSLDLEKESPTKEPSSIFKTDDTVHVLSYSNIGEFGKSTEGIIKAIYKDGTVLVKVDEGIEEVHKEDNVSFTPFSIKEAGFSQIRPVQEPKVGDWGFFYNKVPCERFSYAKLESITDNSTFRFMNENIGYFAYFSIEPPQLAEGIPNPFKEC